MNTTSLDCLHEWRENITSIPNATIWHMCLKQPNCTVKRVIIQLKDLFVDISHLSNSSPLAYSDIIVLDYIANGQQISKLKGNEKVSLKFSKKLENITREQVICLFLDGNQWNKTGTEVGSIEGENIECLTNHLSSFTMVVLKAGKVSESNKVALKFITYIGSGLSLAGLFITCVVYIVLYKDLQILTTSRHLVHLNLQIALGLTQLVFLAGGSVTNDKIICKVIAILVHYFSLTGFTWILLEAVMLYLKLILVYDGEFVRMKNFLLFGWGMIYICKINACKLFCGRKLNSEKCIKYSKFLRAARD
ncbi:adhesion G- coupled receptor D1-like [Paramuricea clavata]|uniref:Adhesion G- coupled receptor D1-like n=1 Tax=Paramuricea clavata TaxID=317549 RepID=A0A7D9E0R8_PARCT|nr:adhesion G- coupled receptor D1-like [Paramuricea clavata]